MLRRAGGAQLLSFWGGKEERSGSEKEGSEGEEGMGGRTEERRGEDRTARKEKAQFPRCVRQDVPRGTMEGRCFVECRIQGLNPNH